MIDRTGKFVCGGSASLGMQGNQGLLLPTQENYQRVQEPSPLAVYSFSIPSRLKLSAYSELLCLVFRQFICPGALNCVALRSSSSPCGPRNGPRFPP